MAYARTEVRKRAGSILDGIPGIKRICLTRRWPREKDKLPCLCLYLPTEDISVASGHVRGQRIIERIETLRVVVVFASSGLADEVTEDAMDACLEEVERRLAANPSLRGDDGIPLATDLRLVRLDTGFDGAGATACFVGSLTFSLKIHHREGRSETLPASQGPL